MRLLAVTAAVVAVASVTTPALAKTAGAMGVAVTAGSTQTMKPTDDATVRSVPATQNFGRQTKLRISGGTVRENVYLRFDVREFTGGVRSAQLRIYSYDSSSVGFDVRTSDPTWSDTTITWANAPSPSAGVVASSGPLRPNTWSTIDVTSGFAGGDRFASLVLTTSDRNPLVLGAEESENRDPQLILTGNRAPNAVTDTVAAQEAAPLAIPASTLLANDTDADGDPLSVSAVAATSDTHGTVTLAGETVTYTPDAGFVGAASFAYTISDGFGGSDIGTVRVTVANIAPTASDLSASTTAGHSVQLPLAATDPGSPPEVLTFAIASGGTHGIANVSGTTATYTPNAGFTGDDSFTYTASDGNGGTSAPATVRVTVRPGTPTADDVQLSADSNAPSSLPLSELGSHLNDPDGDTMTVASVVAGPDTHGDVRMSGNRIVYTPSLSYSGPASFTYTGSDGHGDTATGTVQVTVDHQPGFPMRGAFYYPWFPEAWVQGGMNPFTHYTPTLGLYSSSDAATVDKHLAAMSGAHVDTAIASWWGQGVKHEDTRIPLLLSRIGATASSIRLALYYELEGHGDPSVAQIVSDLQYMQSRYASDPGYLRVGGRFVVFVYDAGPGDAATTCDMAERWKQANDQIGDAAFVVLKVFTGFKDCGSQPDAWHQYAPASAENPQTPWSFAISPGFWLATDATPRLVRNPLTWNQNIIDMVNSDAMFQLVTTFNEWGEGTSVESAAEWGTTYLDELAADGGGFGTPVAPSAPNPGPTLTGFAQPGNDLTAVPGAWPGTPGTFTYQFRRCDSAGASCVDIAGATSDSYVVGSDDLGSTIRALVTDTNSAGTRASLSQPSAIVTTGDIPSTNGICGTQSAPPATYSHVLWIWLENEDLDKVVGSAAAPYLTSVANSCGLARNYAGVAHPSLPNYIAATSGGTQGITDDNAPTTVGHYLNVPNIYQQVNAAGGTWRDYEESAAGSCMNGSSGLYAVKHDPAAYYSNISVACATSDVPLGTLNAGNFLTALTGGGLPTFSFVTPNLCNDGHDCSLLTADTWLRSWLPKLLAGPDYQSGRTAVFITFDENDGGTGNLVPMIAISPSTVPGTVSTTAFTHYSLLRTTEEMLGLEQIGNAATATSMDSAFNLR